MEYICSEHTIAVNHAVGNGVHGDDLFLLAMAEREAGVLELLQKEGLYK